MRESFLHIRNACNTISIMVHVRSQRAIICSDSSLSLISLQCSHLEADQTFW